MQIAHAHHTHGSFAANHSKSAANAKANKHAAFGTMLSQMQAASHTPTAKTETAHPKPNYAAIMSDVEEKIKAEICKKAAEQQEAASQETELPKPGANSQAVADSIKENMNCLYDSFGHLRLSGEHTVSTTQNYFTNGCIKVFHYGGEPSFVTQTFSDGSVWTTYSDGRKVEGYVDFKAPDGHPKEYSKGEIEASINKIKADALEKETYRKEKISSGLMNKIQEALAKNGIEFAPEEKFNIKVDKYLNVTVTGDDEEKAKAMEKFFNSPGSENWGLLLQRHNMDYNRDTPLFYEHDRILSDRKEYTLKANKMLLENYLANATNGKVSLEDLYLSADGKIMGLPSELEKDIYADVKTSLIEILKIGVNNIPDVSANITFGNGGLVFG